MGGHPIPTVRVILEDLEGRVLILQRDNSVCENGQWCLPGGKIDEGKKIEEACKEEIKLETGLGIYDLEFLQMPNNPQDNLVIPGRPGYKHCITLYFRAKHSGVLQLNAESRKSRWIAEEERERYNLVFGNDAALAEYFRTRKEERYSLMF